MTKIILRKPKGVANPVRASCSADVLGGLIVRKVYADRVVDVFRDDNLVVTGGKLRLLRALYVGDASTPIQTLRVGTGGVIDPAGRFPKTAVASQTQLFSEVQSVSVVYSVDTGYPSITYTADIDPDLCNDVLISEAGLFFGDGTMFNIKNFPGIPKTPDFSIHFEWTIRIN